MIENEYLELCKEEIPRLRNYARLAVPWDNTIAEDLVQSTLELAWRHIAGFNPAISKFSTWITSIYRNVLNRYYRDEYEKGSPYNTLSIEDIVTNPAKEESHPELLYFTGQDDRIGLEQALTSMGGIHERIIRMCFIGGYSYNEVAIELYLTPRKVRRIVASGLKKLKYILLEDYKMEDNEDTTTVEAPTLDMVEVSNQDAGVTHEPTEDLPNETSNAENPSN